MTDRNVINDAQNMVEVVVVIIVTNRMVKWYNCSDRWEEEGISGCLSVAEEVQSIQLGPVHICRLCAIYDGNFLNSDNFSWY